MFQHLLRAATLVTLCLVSVTTSYAQLYSVYIYNCRHPANGWQRSGTYGEVGVSKAQAEQKADARRQSGPSYEKYKPFPSTSQTYASAAPACGGTAPTPTCLYFVYIYNSRVGTGWLGGYSSDAEARNQAINFTRAYGGTWGGPVRSCR